VKFNSLCMHAEKRTRAYSFTLGNTGAAVTEATSAVARIVGAASDATAAVVPAPAVHFIGASSSSDADLCQFCREVVRLHDVVLGRRTQDTWVAAVLAAHASGVTAAKAAEEPADGGFGVVAQATLEVLDKLESLFEAVGGMEDDETARGVAHLVSEGVTAASMEAFISTRLEAAAAGSKKIDTAADKPRAETWLTQAFRERDSVKSGSRARSKSQTSKKTRSKNGKSLVSGTKKPKKS
jgi:hypothetical protein